MKLRISVPSSVSIAVIQAALASLGVSIVERKPKAQDVEYPPLTYKKRLCSGQASAEMLAANPDAQQDEDGVYMPMEMDGISVLKAIRKLESAREAYNRRDGRNEGHFPANGENMTTADYVAGMERSWCLVPQPIAVAPEVEAPLSLVAKARQYREQARNERQRIAA